MGTQKHDKADAHTDSSATSSSDNQEISSFAQNLAALESLLFRMEVEIGSPAKNPARIAIYQSDVLSLHGELAAQLKRSLELGNDENVFVARLRALEPRMLRLVQYSESEAASLEGALRERERLSDLDLQRLDDTEARLRAASTPA